MDLYQATGNEYVSLPTLRESDGGIEGISCLYMQLKGMLELKGFDCLIRPFVQMDGKTLALTPRWERRQYWIPVLTSRTGDILFRCTYLAPVGERGFGLRLEAEYTGDAPRALTIGLEGSWDETLHTVNESLLLTQGRLVKDSGWNHLFVFQQVPGLPLIALAPITADDQPFSCIDQGAQWTRDGFAYRIFKNCTLQKGEGMHLDICWGLGYEEVSAATSAKEMLRQGFEALLARTENWLKDRQMRHPDGHIQRLANINRFFAFFFASGRTIDTEELCMVTSRSPRYYVSAAYWDRDSLLWAFPAILQADPAYARELLLSVFRRQARNFGVHSRFIDGTVLEPGFELDELCAPVIALERYTDFTGDEALLRLPVIREALEGIAAKLKACRHPDTALYATFLQPTDDMHRYPYLTYNNVLVFKVLHLLGRWMNCPAFEEEAERVRDAIMTHCVFNHQGKDVFSWSTDLQGNRDIYDEPPGSLQLLPFYGFCNMENSIWRHTVELIRSRDYPLSFAGHPIAEIGCKHAPHPWILSVCNSLLSGHRDAALLHLHHTQMDNGVACESVDEDTGECTTGAAFATCAGFLSFALSETVS